MVILAFFAAAFYIVSQMPGWLETWIKASSVRVSFVTSINEFVRPSVVILAAVLASIGLVFIQSKSLRILWVVFATLMGFVVPFLPPKGWILVLFVPTLIHTYFFTLAFMSFGTIKSKSRPGLVSIMLLLIMPFLLIAAPDPAPRMAWFGVSFIQESGFDTMRLYLGQLSGGILGDPRTYQVILAFTYTYHYLNWFSKTGIIRWHDVSLSRLVAAVVIWSTSVILYFIDAASGIMILFFLSLLHVFLELPLNVVSIRGVLFYILRKNR